MSKEQVDIVIRAGDKSKGYWNDVWSFKDLFYFLAWRDILVRYKQTAIGVAWSVIRPLITLTILTVVFGKVAKLPSGGVPYALLVCSAILPWQLFASGFVEVSNSFISNSNMLSKVYFPRIIVPVSTLMVSLVDFFISFLILLGLMLWYQFVPSWHILLIPVFLIPAVLTVLGMGLLTATLNVKYRDFRYIVPFLVQVGMYISPVGFSSNTIPEKWRLLYSINPMVGVIDGFRWAILGGENQLYLPGYIISNGFLIALLVLGFRYFRKMEKTFADII